MSKCLLHISKLDEFKAWLDLKGIPHRPARGGVSGYQVLQVCKDGQHWNCVYRRDTMPEHYSTDYHLDSLVHQFTKYRKQAESMK